MPIMAHAAVRWADAWQSLPGRPQLAADADRGMGSAADGAANGLSPKPSGGAAERDGGRGAAASPRLAALDRRSDGDAFA